MTSIEETPMRYKVALSLIKGMGAKGTRYFINHIEDLEEAHSSPAATWSASSSLGEHLPAAL